MAYKPPTKKKPTKSSAPAPPPSKPVPPKKPTAPKSSAVKPAASTPASKNAGAVAFATSQLRRAGIKPVEGGDVAAQFRKANKIAARKRTAAGLDRAVTAGASSALAAGMRGPKRTEPLPRKKKPSAAKRKAQGGGT